MDDKKYVINDASHASVQRAGTGQPAAGPGRARSRFLWLLPASEEQIADLTLTSDTFKTLIFYDSSESRELADLILTSCNWCVPRADEFGRISTRNADFLADNKKLSQSNEQQYDTNHGIACAEKGRFNGTTAITLALHTSLEEFNTSLQFVLIDSLKSPISICKSSREQWS